MNSYLLIYPMFAMVLLTFFVLIKLFLIRTKSIKEGQVDAKFYKTYQGFSEPIQDAQYSRHFVNLFEAPVLFFVVCLAGIATGVTAMPFLVLAWTYVIVRIVHMVIHTGNNKIFPRVFAYFLSWFVLLIMWATLMFRVTI